MPRIVREPLRAQIRRQLLEWLLHGELRPNANLSEPELADDLGISRTPLREALLKLEFEGFLKSEPGKGFSVRPLSPDTARDLYELTGTLEVQALADAGVPGPDRLDRLQELDRQRSELVDARGEEEADEMIRLDREWHELLLEDCDNAELLEVLEIVKNRLHRYEFAFAYDFERLGRKGVRQHQEMTDRLREGDLDAALKLLRQHWEMGARTRSAWLRETERLTADDETSSS
jgi:DNA-binding GntR family transcriptional regulator